MISSNFSDISSFQYYTPSEEQSSSHLSNGKLRRCFLWQQREYRRTPHVTVWGLVLLMPEMMWGILHELGEMLCPMNKHWVRRIVLLAMGDQAPSDVICIGQYGEWHGVSDNKCFTCNVCVGPEGSTLAGTRAPTFHHGHWIFHFRSQYIWSKDCGKVLDAHFVYAGVRLNFIEEPWKVPPENREKRREVSD